MKKYFLYFLGLNLIAFAVVLNVRFDLGVAAFSSVMYSISQIYNISLGTASMHIPQELRIRSRGTERHSASN